MASHLAVHNENDVYCSVLLHQNPSNLSVSSSYLQATGEVWYTMFHKRLGALILRHFDHFPTCLAGYCTTALVLKRHEKYAVTCPGGIRAIQHHNRPLHLIYKTFTDLFIYVSVTRQRVLAVGLQKTPTSGEHSTLSLTILPSLPPQRAWMLSFEVRTQPPTS